MADSERQFGAGKMRSLIANAVLAPNVQHFANKVCIRFE